MWNRPKIKASPVLLHCIKKIQICISRRWYSRLAVKICTCPNTMYLNFESISIYTWKKRLLLLLRRHLRIILRFWDLFCLKSHRKMWWSLSSGSIGVHKDSTCSKTCTGVAVIVLFRTVLVTIFSSLIFFRKVKLYENLIINLINLLQNC